MIKGLLRVRIFFRHTFAKTQRGEFLPSVSILAKPNVPSVSSVSE